MIALSAKESNVLGVRVARGVLDDTWQPGQLLQATLDGGYDYVRVKLPSADEQVFQKLDQLGMHYCIHSILVRNSLPITHEHAQPYRPLRVSFELFDGTNEAALKQLVRDSWGNRTAVNYHNPYFRHWVSYEQEMEGSAAYAVEFNHTQNPAMPNWWVKLNGENIGFVLGKVSDEGFEGIMYSILPAYRGQNYAEDIMIFLKKWCYEQGIPTFYNDVVLQNMPSLKSIVTEAILPVDTYLNVTISSLLTATRTAPITMDAAGWQDINNLQPWVADNRAQWEKPGFYLKSMSFSASSGLKETPTQILITRPIDNGEQQLVVIKPIQGNAYLGAVYLDYRH